jgi:hypothetical protein
MYAVTKLNLIRLRIVEALSHATGHVTSEAISRNCNHYQVNAREYP